MRPRRSPAPVVKPQARPPYREWLDEKFNLRKCECRKDWQSLSKATPGICRCRGICPAYVTPEWLTEAKGQALCDLEEKTGYNCYAECVNETADVKWYAEPCGEAGQPACNEPILAHRRAARKAKEMKETKAKEKPVKPVEPPKPAEPSKLPRLTYDPKDVYDLRGLHCELLNGKEQCYYEDAQGRELCPEYVTAEWLAFPKDQYLCSADMAEQFYCTVGCQEGNPEVRWGAHEIAWCFDPKNLGSCPTRPPVIPKSEWKLQEWSEPKEPETRCQAAHRRGEPLHVIEDVTFGMLTHEPRSMRDTLATYEKWGLFEVVAEFLVYINKRRPEVDDVIKPYVDRYPNKIRVMGDAHNYGIARGITFLTGNATKPYFLFLERDFQLIEPAQCVIEEIETGVKMIKAGTAHVVRYRHRKRAGRPNWAERMFKGHEDDVFKGPQPNLFCNHYYWVPEPEKLWPDKIWHCNQNPLMYCSDSYYCNWTNNPQLWGVEWWNHEYVSRFDQFQRNDPWYDLETYMNWEPNSWNDRKFTVAQGQGLFKHVDRGNFGT